MSRQRTSSPTANRARAWERERRWLLSLEPPVEAGVLELVTALRLLGFPTVRSCEGHFVRDHVELSQPYVGIGWQLSGRFLRGVEDGASLYDDPRHASTRERRYLAALGWRRYRPLAWRLRELVAEHERSISSGSDVDTRLRVCAGWWGITLTPLVALEEFAVLAERDLDAADRRLLTRRRTFESFGAFLRDAWLSDLLAPQMSPRPLPDARPHREGAAHALAVVSR